jgi:hypothetical protein
MAEKNNGDDSDNINNGFPIQINQIYLEVLTNTVRKQNIQLLNKIAKIEQIPIDQLLDKYIITKSAVKNIITICNQNNSE